MSVQNGSVIPTKFGQPIFLFAMFFNAASNKRVFAALYKKDGTLLQGNIELPHNVAGQYLNNSILMPSESFLRAIYSAFELDGITPSVDSQITAFDTFQLDTSATQAAALPANAAAVKSSQSVRAKLQKIEGTEVFYTHSQTVANVQVQEEISAEAKKIFNLKGTSE